MSGLLLFVLSAAGCGPFPETRYYPDVISAAVKDAITLSYYKASAYSDYVSRFRREDFIGFAPAPSAELCDEADIRKGKADPVRCRLTKYPNELVASCENAQGCVRLVVAARVLKGPYGGAVTAALRNPCDALPKLTPDHESRARNGDPTLRQPAPGLSIGIEYTYRVLRCGTSPVRGTIQGYDPKTRILVIRYR